MLFEKMLDDPKVGPSKLKIHMQAKRTQAWLKQTVLGMLEDSKIRKRFILEVEDRVRKFESNPEDAEQFLTDPFKIDKCLLVVNRVVSLMPDGKFRRLERLRDRLLLVANKTRKLRIGVAMLPGGINLEREKFPPEWEELI